MKWNALIDLLPNYLWTNGTEYTGLVMTAKLFIFSLIPSLLLAIILALLQVFGPRYLSRLIQVFTYVLRGTPLYLQLMLIYFGLSQFEVVQTGWQNEHPFWLLFRGAMFCTVLALVLNATAYLTELLAGMLATYPRNDIVAAESFGMSRWAIICHLILPATLRRGIPSLNNEMVFLLHATSLASTVTLLDLTGVARAFYAETYSPFIPFLVAAVFYLVCTFLLIFIASRAETKWLAFLRP